jgi:hypothetical protein
MVLWREGFKMMQWIAVAAVLLARGAYAQTTPQRPTFEAFEVATVKPAIEDQKGRYLKMEGAGRFIGKDYTLKLLIAEDHLRGPAVGRLQSLRYRGANPRPGASNA